MFSPDGTTTLTIDNTETLVSGTNFTVADTVDRFTIDSVKIELNDATGVTRVLVDDDDTTFTSSDEFTYFSMGDGIFEFADTTGTRLRLAADRSEMLDETGTADLVLLNGDASITVATDCFITIGNSFTVNDGTRTRIEADTTKTKLTSPDGSNTVSVTNDDVLINGRSAKRMVAFTGVIDDATPGRYYRYGEESNMIGIVMPLPGTVVYLTKSNNGNSNTGSSHLYKNGVITDAQIGIVDEYSNVEVVSESFVAGDYLRMRFSAGTATDPCTTFFVEFDD